MKFKVWDKYNKKYRNGLFMLDNEHNIYEVNSVSSGWDDDVVLERLTGDFEIHFIENIDSKLFHIQHVCNERSEDIEDYILSKVKGG